MSRFWKWFLGITISLVVVAALVGAGFWFFNHWAGGWLMGERVIIQREGRWNDMPWRDDRMPMHQFQPRGFRGFTMPYFHAMPGYFNPLGFIFGGLLRLGLLALAIYGVIALVRAFRQPRIAPVIAPATAAPVEPIVTPSKVVPNCPNCGYEITSSWKHCPNCGSALTT
jgi:hypothetical protein